MYGLVGFPAATVTWSDYEVTLAQAANAISSTRAGNQVIINGAGGLAGATYRILTTTNVELPAVQWTPIVTNQFGASGGFSYTNVIQPNMPAQYVRVILP